MVRPPPPPVVDAFRCANCGGPIELRSRGSLSVACPWCGAVVDAQNPTHELIARYEKRISIKPAIPISARGKIRGEEYACLGFLRRQVVVEGEAYSWSEYLLWHPQRGYRWLTEYEGNWTYVNPCKGLPAQTGDHAIYLGRSYKIFQSSVAETTFALGEFPWQVERGEKTDCTDFVSPPFLLSRETTGNETTWSIGESIDGEDVWSGFALEGDPPAKRGVGAAEVSPFEPIARPMGATFWIVVALLVLFQVVGVLLAKDELVLTDTVDVDARSPGAHVTRPFRLEGRSANVEIEIETNLNNAWADFGGSLIDADSREATEFFQGIEYWHGVDEGTSWTEGSRTGRILLGSVPAGTYELLLDAETDRKPLHYTVRVNRDVPRFSFFFLALFLVAGPYLVFLYRRRQFEYRRWLESDYPMRPLITTTNEEE